MIMLTFLLDQAEQTYERSEREHEEQDEAAKSDFEGILQIRLNHLYLFA